MRGFTPCKMPCKAVLAVSIDDGAIEYRVAPSMSRIVADTLTAGEVCSLAEFFNSNITRHDVPDTVPPAAVVSTSCPELCVQTPRVPKRSNVDVTCSVDVSNVCDPVSPEMVTVDPLARS